MNTDLAAYAAAAQSLRDTAKWYAGGVAGTAAGVFAGSSLTKLGSLTWETDPVRLGLAGGGVVLGFLALGFILKGASRVLTRDIYSLNLISRNPSDHADHAAFTTVKARLNEDFKGVFAEHRHFDSWIKAGNEAFGAAQPTEQEKHLKERVKAVAPAMKGTASFLLVREYYIKLEKTLNWAPFLAIVGFGLFAWAANPPEPEKDPAATQAAVAAPAASPATLDAPAAVPA